MAKPPLEVLLLRFAFGTLLFDLFFCTSRFAS